MANEHRKDDLIPLTKSLTISHEIAADDTESSPDLVTAVGPNQFCDPCIKTFLEQEKLGREYDDVHAVDHHRTFEDFSHAVDGGCPLCGRTLEKLLNDSEFLAAQDTQADLANTHIRISAIWKDTNLTYEVHWGVSGEVDEVEGVEKSLGTVRVIFHRAAIRELDTGKDIVKRASVPLSNPHQEFATTSSIDIRSWLQTCAKHHSCLKDRNPDYLPPRLFCWSDHDLRLIETSTIRESHESISYATLSHCWGTTATNLTLDSDNIDQFYAEIKFSNLPATFKDAIKVSKKLGLSFLWIDSLCIIQRGPRHKTDWELHVREMADIYANGFINIAASWSASSTGGCFYPRALGLSRACVVDINGTMELYEDWDYGMTDMFHLNSRAWVFQERMMSPRVIHYHKNDVFWECKELFASSKFPKGLPQYKRRFGSTPLFQVPFGNERHWELPNLEDNAHVHWLSLVRKYIQSDITRPDDRLPAMSAIARKINETYIHEEFVAGFFKSSLPAGLLWAAGIGQPVHRPDSYVAPSWSWASVQGRIFVVPDQENDFVIPYAKVKSFSMDFVDPQNPYGQIKDGSMLIEASILRLGGAIPESGYQSCKLKLPRFELQSEVYIRLIWDTGSSPFAEREEFNLLCIGERTIDSEYQGLIISPVSDGADQARLLFSRIGFWSIHTLYAGMNASLVGEEGEEGVEKNEKIWKKGLKKLKKKIGKAHSQKNSEYAFWEQLQNYVQSEVEELTLV